MQGTALVRSTKRWGPPLGAWFIATGCAYSRVHLGYHTADQVYAGLVLGCVLGVVWFWLYETVYISIVHKLERLLAPFDFRSPHDARDLAAERRKSLDARRQLDAQRKSGWKKST